MANQSLLLQSAECTGGSNQSDDDAMDSFIDEDMKHDLACNHSWTTHCSKGCNDESQLAAVN